MNKKTILFHLRRLLRDYEPVAVDHVAVAQRGASYVERQVAEDRAAVLNAERQGAYEALNAAIDLVRDTMKDDPA